MILDGFPTLFEDELLYSALARFYDRQGYVFGSDARRELLGLDFGAFKIALPSSIRFLSARIPYALGYSAKYLIWHHTLFPYYTAFMPIIDRNRIYRTMLRIGRKSTIDRLVGHLKSKLARLRYCPLCLLEDKERFKHLYWHRSHQIPQIDMCHKHGVFLVDSTVSAQGQLHLISADKAISIIPEPDSIDFSNPDHVALHCFAKNAHWLLTASRPHSLPNLSERYFIAAMEAGLINRNTIANYQIFQKSLQLLSRPLRNKLNLCFSAKSPMIRSLSPRGTVHSSTLHHIALMYILDVDIADFWDEEFCNNPEKQIDGKARSIAKHREIWQTTRVQHPEMSISELQQLIPTAYQILWRKDKEWLNANKPPIKRRAPISKNELPNLDFELASTATSAGDQLRDRPQRITLGRLCKEIGILTPWYCTRREDLPLTVAVFQQYIETSAQFQRRRIKLDIENFYE